MSVQEYLEKHKLSMRIEDAVNAAVRAKSPDPVIFIVWSSILSPSLSFSSSVLGFARLWLLSLWMCNLMGFDDRGSKWGMIRVLWGYGDFKSLWSFCDSHVTGNCWDVRWVYKSVWTALNFFVLLWLALVEFNPWFVYYTHKCRLVYSSGN